MCSNKETPLFVGCFCILPLPEGERSATKIHKKADQPLAEEGVAMH
jgi:hypothetical protein